MIATLTCRPKASHQAAVPDFLEMLPTIRRAANYAFRSLRRAVREDLMAEVVANAFAAFQRLIARGKAALAYPTVLAKFAIRQVRAGRRVGSKRNALDVLSAFAQRCQGFTVQSLTEATECGAWLELVVEDRRASPAEIAGFKIDFAAWLKRLKRSKRQMALRLAAGDTTNEVAAHFRISAGRVSQLRQELRNNWNEFQGAAASD